MNSFSWQLENSISKLWLVSVARYENTSLIAWGTLLIWHDEMALAKWMVKKKKKKKKKIFVLNYFNPPPKNHFLDPLKISWKRAKFQLVEMLGITQRWWSHPKREFNGVMIGQHSAVFHPLHYPFWGEFSNFERVFFKPKTRGVLFFFTDLKDTKIYPKWITILNPLPECVKYSDEFPPPLSVHCGV